MTDWMQTRSGLDIEDHARRAAHSSPKRLPISPRRGLQTLSVFVAMTTCLPAFAEGYGPPKPRGYSDSTSGAGPYWLGVENLFGYSSLTQKVSFDTELGNSESEVDSSQFSLLGGGTGNAYAAPRLSLDAKLGRSFTLGGALTYATGTAGSPSPSGTVEADASSFALHARVGFLIGSDKFAVWPRLGWAPYSSSLETDDTITTTSGSAVVLDLPVVLRGSLVGVSLGPSFYIPVSGSVESRTGQDETLKGSASLGGWAFNFSGFVML